jgi:hypothetical protein
MEHDFNRFHHTIPGLRRSGVDANAIRQVCDEVVEIALTNNLIKQFLPFHILAYCLCSTFIPMEVKHNFKALLWDCVKRLFSILPALFVRLGLDCVQCCIFSTYFNHRIPTFLWFLAALCYQASRTWRGNGSKWVYVFSLYIISLK